MIAGHDVFVVTSYEHHKPHFYTGSAKLLMVQAPGGRLRVDARDETWVIEVKRLRLEAGDEDTLVSFRVLPRRGAR